MKKTITIIALLVISTLTFAGKPLKVKSGNINFLKEDAVAKIEMDYSNTTWEKKNSYKEFCAEEYDGRVEQSGISFIEGFNTTSKALKLTNSDEEAQYTLVVHVADLERKFQDIAYFYIRVCGTITVMNNQTGEEVCEIEIDKLSGSASFVPNDRLASCFKTLGVKLAKMK